MLDLPSLNIPGLAFFNRNVDGVMIEEDLQSQELPRQINAVKQVIAFMTIGKDMSMHYNDVANLVASTNLQLKKLVYLYLMQNSRTQPEKAVLQAGTFSHDTQHESPLIRGIALRTMSSMQVVAMVDFLLNPILRCLRDADAYVRRTAVFAALKLHSIAPASFTESGVGLALVELLSDPIASVVASVVAVITELLANGAASSLALALLQKLNTLMAALTDCGEWQQHYLLEGVSLLFSTGKFAAMSLALDDADTLVTRVLPLLSSANAAVVSSAVKIIVLFIQQYLPGAGVAPMKQAQLESKYASRIIGPMMSLCMAARYELRFAAMRNVLLLIQVPRFRDGFAPYVSSFFVKYDDAVYIKMEKLGILTCLVNRTNWEAILEELVEYSSEVDLEFVRKSVRSMGLVAIKVEPAAGSCVEQLVKLIETEISYVVQEAAVVVQMVLRQYHDRFDGVISTLCSALSILDNAESKAAVAWVIGEFADRVANAPEVLTMFFETLNEESTSVQLSVLTSVVKAYLTSTDAPKEKLQKMLEDCLATTTRSHHPDVRDRAFFYWRLIVADIRSAKEVILATKPPMTDFSIMEKSIVSELLCEFGSASSIVHKPQRFLMGDPYQIQANEDELFAQAEEPQPSTAGADSATLKDSANVLESVPETTSSPSSSIAPQMPPLGSSSSSSTAVLPFAVVLPSAAGSGVEIAMAWSQNGTLPLVHFRFTLAKAAPTSAVDAVRATALASMVRIVMLQLNVNMFGLGIAQEVPVKELTAGNMVQISLAVNCNNGKRPVRDVQVAVKLDPIGVLYFNAPTIPSRFLLLPVSSAVDPVAYVAAFKSLNPSWSLPANLANKYQSAANKLTPNSLKMHNFVLVHQKEIPNKRGFHLFCETIARQKLYIELTLREWMVSTLVVRSTDENISHIIGEHFLEVICGAGDV